MTRMTYKKRAMTPFADSFNVDGLDKLDAKLIDAHARADYRLAQEASLDNFRMLQESAEFLRRPGPTHGDANDSGLTMMAQAMPRSPSSVRQIADTTLPFAATPFAGSNLNFLRTFDHGSERRAVGAVHEGTLLEAPGVAGQYASADLATGELAVMLMVGESAASPYDYPPSGATPVLGVLEASSQSVYVENWIHPGDASPTHDIGAVATIALPSKAQAWVEPTRNGLYGGLVTAMGDATFELYACVTNGKEFYQRRATRFLSASASSFGRAGEPAFSSPVSLGAEMHIPPGATLIVMRVTLTLWTLRALAEGGLSPVGGLVGAVLADREGDPANGMSGTEHPGRARVLLSSVVCRG